MPVWPTSEANVLTWCMTAEGEIASNLRSELQIVARYRKNCDLWLSDLCEWQIWIWLALGKLISDHVVHFVTTTRPKYEIRLRSVVETSPSIVCLELKWIAFPVSATFAAHVDDVWLAV